jgi:hypothetical protein
MKRALYVLFILISIVYFSVTVLMRPPLHAESLWRDSHLFSTRGVIQPGDILKIQFAYRNIIRYRNEMKTGESEESSFGQPSIKTFSFLPSLENTTTHNRNSNLEYNNEREFSMRIAVTVESASTNGIVNFSGGHTVILNGQSERILLQGQVRMADIGEGNTVTSTDIANLTFAWHGPQVMRQQALSTNDLVATATNEDGSPAASDGIELTPEAKQRLLMQYLNRIHDILFRE